MPPTNYSLINTRPKTYHDSRRAVRSEKVKAKTTKKQDAITESKAGIAKQRLALADQRKAQIKSAPKTKKNKKAE